MATILDVSRKAGVSTATVSRALSNPEKVSEATLRKVQKAVASLNYRPNSLARNLRTDKSSSVLVLIPGLANVFFSNVLLGIERAAKAAGYSVLLGDTRDKEQLEDEYYRLLETRVADGVIHLAPNQNRAAPEDRGDFPIVYACGSSHTPSPSVRIDNIEAARTVVADLIDNGHRTIACIAGRRNNPHVLDRMRGYRRALKDADLPLDNALVKYGDFSMGSGVLLTQELLQLRPRPTAIFCMNDEAAMGALEAIRGAKLNTPKDVAVTGFDDIVFAQYFSPSLTTIAQPAEQMGAAAFDMLLRAMHQEPFDPGVVLPFEYLKRESSNISR